jgi:hypothetical protein
MEWMSKEDEERERVEAERREELERRLDSRMECW